jgi:hypothetical protein
MYRSDVFLAHLRLDRRGVPSESVTPCIAETPLCDCSKLPFNSSATPRRCTCTCIDVTFLWGHERLDQSCIPSECCTVYGWRDVLARMISKLLCNVNTCTGYSSSLLLSLYDSTIGCARWCVYHVLVRPLIGYCINLVTQL